MQKQKKKKFLVLGMAAVMSFAAIGMSNVMTHKDSSGFTVIMAEAAGAIKTWGEVDVGKGLTASLSDSGTLVISGNGEMLNWSDVTTAPWYQTNYDKIKYVIIEDGVTNIGALAFYGCTNLKCVLIGKGVKTIGKRAFNNCSRLASMALPNNVTSIGDEAFKNCGSIECFDTGNGVESIGQYAFYECKKLESMIIGNRVKNIGYQAFAYCTALKYCTIGNSVTSIADNAFKNCTALLNIEIPINVTSMGYEIFYNCGNLKVFVEAQSQPSGWNSKWDRYYYTDGMWTTEKWLTVVYNQTFIKQHEHIWNKGEVIEEATCSNEGMVAYICERNEYHKKNEIILKTNDHNYVDGICIVCGDVHQHNWDNGVVVQTATCIKEGDKLYTCKDDPTHTKHESYKVPHNYVDNKCTMCGDVHKHDWDEGVIVKTATCAREGEKVYTCKSDPTHTKRETIKKTNSHNYVDGYCKVCNKKDTSLGYIIKTFTAKVISIVGLLATLAAFILIEVVQARM